MRIKKPREPRKTRKTEEDLEAGETERVFFWSGWNVRTPSSWGRFTPYPMSDNEAAEKPLSTGEWFVTLLVLGLPLVGLVMYFVWGFGPGNVSRRNFCRAVLLWLAILLALGLMALIAFVIFGGTLAALINQASQR